jgi:hypothetical protein
VNGGRVVDMTDTENPVLSPIGVGVWTGDPAAEAAEAEFDNVVVT